MKSKKFIVRDAFKRDAGIIEFLQAQIDYRIFTSSNRTYKMI